MNAAADLGHGRDPALDDPVRDVLPEPPGPGASTRLRRGVARLGRGLFLAAVILASIVGLLLLAAIALALFGVTQIMRQAG